MSAQVMTTEDIKNQRKPDRQSPDTQVGLASAGGFELTMRIANMLANSTMVPEQFRIAMSNKKAAKQVDGTYPLVENPNGLSNCVIALNMANRMGADPLMIMQNLYLIEGRPSWSSQFIIAAINNCGRYSPLRFDIKDEGEIEVQYATKKWVNGERGQKGGFQETAHKIKIRNLVCVAWAIEKGTNERLESSPISMKLAVQEGWYQKSGSKWQTMPDQMLRYRAASFFGRIYAPELLMGLRSEEEERDFIDVTPIKPDVEPTTVEDVAKKATTKKSEKVAETVVDEVKTVEEKAQMIPTASINNVIAEFDAAQTQDDLEALYNTRVMPHYSSIRSEDHDRLNQAHEKNTARLSQQQAPDNHQQPDADDPFGNME